MKNKIIFYLSFVLILFPHISLAAVNLPWSSTYNCNEWKTSDGQNPNCDGLWEGGGWTCDNGDGTYKEEQITAAANYSGGGGGKGQRHWLGDGVNNTSGGMSASFLSSQTEIWVRWYMRYEQGFEWNPYLMNQKIIYFDPTSFPRLIVLYYGPDKVRVYSYASGQGYESIGNGWNTMMANGSTDARGNKTSDGQWHLWEFHVKIDTNGTDGILELWIDNNKVINVTNANLAAATLTTLLIGSNGFTPGNGRCMFVDYDDIAISTTGPIGGNTPPPSGGNPPSNNLGSDSSASGGSGCGFVKDDGKGQKAKGEGVSMMILLFLLLILFRLRNAWHRRLFMRKLNITFLTGIFLFLNANISLAAVNLPWSTTYNCNEWKQSDGLYPPAINCDGLTGYGDWKTTDGKEEQITSAANFSGGGGGKGQRHWLGDPLANNSGGTKIEWTSPQPELWIRWYMRFQSGFEWNPQIGEYKILYVDVGTSRHIIIGFRPNNERLGIVVNGYSYDSTDGNGWNTIMANGGTDVRGNKTSDGQWHLYEIHLKMDTNGADGIVEWWVDGVRRLYRTDVNFRTHSGWSYMAIGENHAWSGNGPAAYYVDYDDIAISATGPIGGNTPPPSGNTPPSNNSGGSGCGFVKDSNSNKVSKSQSGKALDIGLMIMLIIILAGMALARRLKGCLRHSFAIKRE